jgi:hypothetical protein
MTARTSLVIRHPERSERSLSRRAFARVRSFAAFAAQDDGLRHTFLTFFILAALLAPQFSYACAVCYGSADSALTKGTNNGIAVLLGVVFFVQLGFVALFWSFWRRAQALRRRRESMRVIQGGAV